MRAANRALVALSALAVTAGAITAVYLVRQDNGSTVAATPVAHNATTTSASAVTTTVTTTVAPTTTPPPPPPPPAAPATKAAPKTTTPKPKPKPAAPKPKPAQAVGAPCAATARACIDLSAAKSWLLDGAGHVIYGPVPITSGRPGYRTPVGTFHVQWKDIDHLSREFDNAPMPYSVFFVGGIAFHQGSLSVASHGCIHLSSGAAKTYFNTLHVGDVVQVVP